MRKLFFFLTWLLVFPAQAADHGTTTIAVNQVTVASTATLVANSRPLRHAITINNTSASTVFVGDTSAVTATTGGPVASGQALTLDTTDQIYAITATGTAAVGVIETFGGTE